MAKSRADLTPPTQSIELFLANFGLDISCYGLVLQLASTAHLQYIFCTTNKQTPGMQMLNIVANWSLSRHYYKNNLNNGVLWQGQKSMRGTCEHVLLCQWGKSLSMNLPLFTASGFKEASIWQLRLVMIMIDFQSGCQFYDLKTVCRVWGYQFLLVTIGSDLYRIFGTFWHIQYPSGLSNAMGRLMNILISNSSSFKYHPISIHLNPY